MYLPEEMMEPIKGYPHLVCLSGQPGIGKSSLFRGLNMNGYKCLVLDLQSGYQHIGGYKVDIKEIAQKEGISLLKAYSKVLGDLIKAKNEGNQYDFIVVDPLTAWKPMIIEKAAEIYNNSMVGKSQARKLAEEKFATKTPDAKQIAACMSKDPVAELGQNGWNFYGQAFSILYQSIQGLAKHCLFFVAHTKYNTLKKTEISEIAVKEIDFWPSYLLQIIGDASDSCAVYREENTVVASFKVKAEQSHFKSRWFDGQDIVLSTKKEDGTIETHWERIFPFLLTNKEN